ncbi:MAG: rhodanese-like domain-containing protein [Gemmatimonadales bacterium]
MRRKSLVLTVAVVLLLAAVAVGLTARPAAFAVLHRKTAHRFPQVHWITAGDLAQWMADSARPRPLLLDARTQEEYSLSHLESAQRIDPYHPDFAPLKAFRRDTPIVVYCAVGYRSARVAYRLGQLGFTRGSNLQGGVFQWANQGRPLVRDGLPAAAVHPFNSRWGLLLERRYRAEAPDLEQHSAAP